MARRGAAATDEPKGPPVISKKKLNQLLASARSTKNDIAEIAGTFGQEIKDAVEGNHLHRKAFSTTKMLDRMEPEKLAEFFYHFDRYIDLAGLRDRAATAPALGLPDGDGEDAEEDGNVRQLHAAE